MKSDNAVPSLWDMCPICKRQDIKGFAHSNGHPLFICASCRHVFFREIPDKNTLIQHYKSEYTKGHNQITVQTGNRSYYQSHFLELKALLDDKDNLSILDYGCSYPIFLEVAKEKGAKVMGCDYSPEAAEYGRQRGIKIISPESLDSLETRFDIIRISHCVEHMVSPLDSLKWIKRLLNPGGIVHITQPCFPTFKLDGFSSSVKDAEYPNHLHFFNPLSFLTLAKNLDLIVIKFFTHQNAKDNLFLYGPFTDYKKSAECLSELECCGDAFFGFLNNYPHFMGDNVVMNLGTK